MGVISDRELLELAAKANGGLVYVEDMGWIFEDENGNRGKWWNPLTDDGDALRLAVKLGLDSRDCLTLYFGEAQAGFMVNENFPMPPDAEYLENHNSEPYTATRRAIVRAAAEIGRSMP